MSFDLMGHMNAMSRVVRDAERDGQPVKAVIASTVYATDAADLWDALTSPARLARWFAPVSGDLRLGGRFQVEGNASGTITECVSPHRIAATWEFGGGLTWIEIALTAEEKGTRLELQHIAPLSPHWEMFGPGAVGVGWDLGFMGLARHLAEPGATLPQEAVTGWMQSDEARSFIRGTSSGWGSAAIAAGDDEARAREAAETTRKFYSGEMPPPAM